MNLSKNLSVAEVRDEVRMKHDDTASAMKVSNVDERTDASKNLGIW